MALYVNTNLSSLDSQRRLAAATASLDTTYQRLSSGQRINSAKDDAAGLQISDRLTVQVEGLGQGNRNANDGIALCQTMEGALDETTSMLQRIRVLALQSANGTNSESDRTAIQREVDQLSEEITRIAEKTTFGGQLCLAGAAVDNFTEHNVLSSTGEISFQVGAYADDTLTLNFAEGFTLSGIYMMGFAGTVPANTIRDGIKVLPSVHGDSQYRFSVSTATTAQASIGTLDTMIEAVDSRRAILGAMQNRMESTIRNQANVAQNVSDARSRIRDTDYAEASSALTAQNILQQTSQTILSQANQRPQVALALLQG
ncbi:MAG: flagellin [Succinivibrionaceae bacterium]|nr:flagellin [Succinivibrionaceae bacterium]